MFGANGPFGEAISDIQWKTLRYYNVYRCFIAAMLFASSLLYPSPFSIVVPEPRPFYLGVTGLYLAATAVSLFWIHTFRKRFNRQLSLHVLVDILVLTALIHAGGGLRSGLGTMLLVTLAGAGLVGQGRLVLFYAAMATLAVLLEQSYRAVTVSFEMADFFQAGLFSTGFFGVAASASLLARKVIANEALARQRGVDLRNQTLISQRVIEEMQDGVLVINRSGWVKQHNPRSEQLLGLGNASERMLSEYSTELAQKFADWREHPSDEPLTIRAPASGMLLRARFVGTESSDRDVLIFLEDMGQLQEQARRLKLAALGRLTASIAHEIRNPLSAINHAGELLQEERLGDGNGRLLRIILDNTQRVERIVSDVLELGRRDRIHRARVDLRQALPALMDEYAVKDDLISSVVVFEFSGVATLSFDRSHLQQVMWNLLSNALRHSQRQAGSVRIRVHDDARPGWVRLRVSDDGPGVDEAHREQVFEPFFTTHSRGTGLGLYIARELCEANGARLQLLESQVGADFCITGRASE